MVSERYFLFGIEEMGIAIGSIIREVNLNIDILRNLIESIKSGKIPKDRLIEILDNIINNSILGVMISDPQLGNHIKKQFLDKKGKSIILSTDFSDPILIEINSNSKLVNIKPVDSSINVPKIHLTENLLIEIFKNDFRLLKFLTLPSDDPLSISISEHEREYIADLIVRIFMTVATTILIRDDLRYKIVENIDSLLQTISSIIS
ncbi:MAG: hypothetical protein ACTSPQ_00735 [Candidatus Helarchaeota archaeon]